MPRVPRQMLIGFVAMLAVGCGGSAPSTPGTTVAAASSPVIEATPSSPTASGHVTSTPIPTSAPLGDRLVASITVPLAPCAMTVDATSVWITGNSTGELVRVDPSTNAVADRIALEGAPCGAAVGPDGRIWVAELGTGAVVAVDPASRKVTTRIGDVGPQLWDLKAGFGAIWVADRSAKAVLRIDPASASITARIPVGPQPAGLAVVVGGVWVSDDIDGRLRRIDPATNMVTMSVAAAGAPTWFSDDGAANLVIAERGAGEVRTVDAASGALGDPIGGWNGPLDGTVVGGVAWIPEGGGRRVGVFELGSVGATVVRYALPGAVNPFVAEPGFGDVWVLDFGGRTIWRIRP